MQAILRQQLAVGFGGGVDMQISRSLPRAHQTAFAGLFVAVGLLLPYVTGHAAGVPGTVLLPMHLPVFLCGFICGKKHGVICGAITPLLSTLLTGMPPLFPTLPGMMCELAVYGLLSGYLYQEKKRSIYPALLISMVGGRLVSGLVVSALLTANTGALKLASVAASFVTGLPGIVIQLIAVPPIVTLILRHLGTASSTPARSDQAHRQEAVRMIRAKEASCVIYQDGDIVSATMGRGIAPLIDIYTQTPELLQGALVVDKIVGKAAAIVLVMGGARAAHGVLVSDAALAFLQAHNVPVSYETRVVSIRNRAGDGICPIERSVLHIEDAAKGLATLQQTLAEIQKAM